MKFREDMLLRVMDAAGIDVGHRDAFVAFAADYDHDDNGYLKKAELEDAAKAWNEANGEAVKEKKPPKRLPKNQLKRPLLKTPPPRRLRLLKRRPAPSAVR